jgi:UDP-N-acetylmuramoylalanine--D-glutamate ligase
MTKLGDILVVGLGASGMESARYAAALVRSGEAASVAAVDSGDSAVLRDRARELASLGVNVRLGSEVVEGKYDLAIASPGIPPAAPLFGSARRSSKRLVSEIEFAYSRSTQPWVAVTGTNGKTTTTSLIEHLLNVGGIPARAVGNIGHVAITAVSSASDTEVFVAEVSSFQLANIDTFRPRVAVLLNLTPDHLNWHGTLEEYALAKARIFENLGEGDTAVVDVDDAGSAPYADQTEARGVEVVRVSRLARHARGASSVGGMLELDGRGGAVRLVSEDELLIKGAHNVSNALAAAAVAHALGVSPSSLRDGLRTFAPIEHRLEPVADIRGVGWFNDSKATNPDAVLKALTAFGDRPLVVLLGGRNKGNDMRPLARAVSDRAKAAVLFGEAGPEIAEAFRGLGFVVVGAPGLEQAVAAAAAIAEPGDAVVLSPACASFDEFDSFEQRGTVFKSLVLELAAGGCK